MDDSAPKPEFDNAAWVRIATKLDKKTLFEFCLKVERLFRLNPYLHFQHWEQKDQNKICASWENHSDEIVRDIDTCLELETKDYEIRINYQSGVKIETYFMVEPNGQYADLVIVDRYGTSEYGQADEVDKSIHAWGVCLNRFFRHYAYLRHVPFSMNVIDRFWIRLTPMARRISYILFVVTTVEVVALILLVLLLVNY